MLVGVEVNRVFRSELHLEVNIIRVFNSLDVGGVEVVIIVIRLALSVRGGGDIDIFSGVGVLTSD